ncbi:MAG: Lrp/AsnC family transcriptional regulator [Desulfobacteraceae bacterium]|nr:Lrp/AsnC family transcriptional regulator [Desulfobacteraceae bacterium]
MLDNISIQILKILQKKARIPNVEVARQVGLAPSAVLERIRKLEKHGFIDGYEVRLNPECFNRSLVGFIHIVTDAGANGEKLAQTLAAMVEVQEVHFVAGQDGYLIKVRVSDSSELDKLLRKNIGSVQGVRSTRTLIVTSTIKETAQIPIDDLGI